MAKRIQELEQTVSELQIGPEHHDADEAPKVVPSPLSPDSTANSTDPQAATPDLPDLNVDANGRVCSHGMPISQEIEDFCLFCLYISFGFQIAYDNGPVRLLRLYIGLRTAVRRTKPVLRRICHGPRME